MKSYKPLFSRFLKADPERIHLAAHSHHYWPDVTLDAQIEAWEDAARYVDHKWEHIFSHVLSDVREGIARELDVPDASNIAFASNTHELVTRIFSSLFSETAKPKLVTTDGEFHSFARQLERWEEERLVEVVRVPTEPLDTFSERFSAVVQRESPDVVYVSHVFFDSGFVVPELDRIVATARPNAYFILDGYHSFFAVPFSLRSLASRVFYVSGGYKYAMSGEGACFVVAPPGFAPRPVNTGWFATFGDLAKSQKGVAYPTTADRFFGATMDPAAWYRMRSVFRLMTREGIETARVLQRSHTLQEEIVARCEAIGLNARDLLVQKADQRGRFLTFRTREASSLHTGLLKKSIVCDFRGDRLRFGIGLYTDPSDIAALFERNA